MVKKVPHESWPQLEKGKCCVDNQMMDAEVNYEDKPIFELSHVKHAFYEKGQDLGVLHIYVKNIVKDSLSIQFEESNIVLKWQTTEKKFLSLHESARDDTVFLWRVTVKEAILPEQCSHKLSSTCLELTLKKKIPQRWGALEPLQKSAVKPVPANTWVQVTRSSPVPCATVTGSAGTASTQKSAFSERQKETSGRKMHLRSENSPSRLTRPDTNTSIESFSASAVVGQKDVTKKPTCLVSPLNKSKLQEQVVIPGFTGLDNLGNTCFMNSGLQCLANTREFRDYFLDGTFQAEINTDNPLGTGGKLAVAFAVLLKVLWSGTLRSYAPSKLKTLIGMKAAQFTGFAQHDAQEFMAFLLDGLHEDLNRIKVKPYIQNIESEGRPDEEVAEESWQQYKRRNDSVVVDLFQGQYKSKLVCPMCHKVSITFDPFLYLSVPLPKKMKTITVFFFFKDPSRRPVKYLIKLSQDAVVEDLKEKIFLKTSVHPSNQRVLEAYKSKIHKFFGKGSSLSCLNTNDSIFVFEILDEKLVGEPVLQVAVIQRAIMPKPVTKCSHCKHDSFPGGAKLRRCTKCYRAAYCNQTCQKNHWVIHKNNCKLIHELIGQPFILSLPESQATFSKLVRLMDAYSRHSVDVFQPPVHDSCPQKMSPFLHPPESCSSLSSELHTCQKPEDSVTGRGNDSLQPWVMSSSQSSSGDDAFMHPHTGKCNIEAHNMPLEPAGSPTLPQHASSSVVYPEPAELSLDNDSAVATEKEQDAQHKIDTLELEFVKEKEAEIKSTEESTLDNTSGSVSALTEYQVTKSQSHSFSSQSCTTNELSNASLAEKENPISEDLIKCDLSGEKDLYQERCPEIDNTSSWAAARAISALDEISTNVACGQQPLTRAVFGHPQYEQTFPPFYVRILNQQGPNHLSVEGETVEDKGPEPLDLSSCYYIAMDWKNNEKMQNFVLVQSKELEHDCSEQDAEFSKIKEQNEITLDQCLQLFTEPEVLSPQEAWYCPQCKDHREATKQLSLWRLPTVLIIQLKRFSFKNLIWREKIDKMVEFPIRGLDLSPYFCGPQSHPNVPPVYDLFAVINHHGGILGGHYTAFGRCVDPQNIRRSEVDWRLFDDSRVMSVEESNVAMRAAYVLFYRRRGVSFSLPTLLSTGTKTVNKEQKQRENQMETDLYAGHTAMEQNPILDSNILAYAEEERDLTSSFPTPDMDMVD